MMVIDILFVTVMHKYVVINC